MSMLAILLLGFSVAVYYFYLDMARLSVTSSPSDLKMLSNVRIFCYVTFSVNGFLFLLSIFGHVSRWLNKRVCFLVLMVFVFTAAIVLLVILGLSVGLFSNFASLAPSKETQLRGLNPPDESQSESSENFESIDQLLPSEKGSPGQALAYQNLEKVYIKMNKFGIFFSNFPEFCSYHVFSS